MLRAAHAYWGLPAFASLSMAGSDREKVRVTIEKTFEALFKLVQELDEEESRALREGLDDR